MGRPVLAMGRPALAMVLRLCYETSGTELVCATSSRIRRASARRLLLRYHAAHSLCHVRYHATHFLRHVQYHAAHSYAMSGTMLRTCYAMSGTDAGHRQAADGAIQGGLLEVQGAT
eukprot:3009228-Rhodomonas_salina.1